jgi:hypothetical protein
MKSPHQFNSAMKSPHQFNSAMMRRTYRNGPPGLLPMQRRNESP